jgi:hypothetical protein
MKKFNTTIDINSNFSVIRDSYCWHLTESYIGKGKDGVDKVLTNTTYHPNLKLVCRYILDRECGKCESLDQIIDMLDRAEKATSEFIENAGG